MFLFKKKNILIFIFIFSTQSLTAQSAVMKAFQNSYAAEYRGDYAAAIVALQAISGDRYEVNLRLGALHAAIKSHETAAAYYQKAVNAMPYSIEARLGYVLPLADLSRWTEVRQQYEEILKICPQHNVANYRLGLIYYYNNDFKTAKKYFDIVLNLYPFDFDAVHMSAWNALKMNKKAEAMALFERALLIRPLDATANDGWQRVKNGK
jgi:tetratricopeptide (TPR) repeat protein